MGQRGAEREEDKERRRTPRHIACRYCIQTAAAERAKVHAQADAEYREDMGKGRQPRAPAHRARLNLLSTGCGTRACSYAATSSSGPAVSESHIAALICCRPCSFTG